jgi:hypothetical protein
MSTTSKLATSHGSILPLITIIRGFPNERKRRFDLGKRQLGSEGCLPFSGHQRDLGSFKSFSNVIPLMLSIYTHESLLQSHQIEQWKMPTMDGERWCLFRQLDPLALPDAGPPI